MRKVLNKKRTIVGTVLILLLSWLGVSIISDLKSNAEISIIPDYKQERKGNINQVLFNLINEEDYVSAHIQSVCDYMDGRYDCSDFATPSIMRILYEYSDKLRPDDLKRLKKTVLVASLSIRFAASAQAGFSRNIRASRVTDSSSP